MYLCYGHRAAIGGASLARITRTKRFDISAFVVRATESQPHITLAIAVATAPMFLGFSAATQMRPESTP